MSNARKILVGLIWHEGHSFNPIVTRREDFSFSRGLAMLSEARAASTSLSGIVEVAERLGYECVPTLAARARPGGPIDESVFLEIADEFVAAAGQGGFDAICLDLHGATLAEQTVDPEGELLERLRKVVGHEMPIAVALDLHGYVTDKMIRSADMLTGYRTTPHADIKETGERAMMLLDRVIRTGERPHAVRTRIPFLTRGNDETSQGPMVAICAEAERLRQDPKIFDISIFNVHPFLNVQALGQVVLAYDDGSGAGVSAARQLAGMLWEARDEFQEKLTSVEAALEIAATSDGPLAVGDQGDRVVGAGPGDSPEIARIALEKFPNLRVALPIYDPNAVAAAREAGEGSELSLSVGAGITHNVRPLQGNWRVVKLLRADFVNKGPYFAGTRADFGDAAVLALGNVTAVVTSMAPNVHDPAFYEAMGVPVAEQDVVVARAANHYKLSFAGIARTMTIDTPGLTAFRPHEFPYTVARPFHPLDEVVWDFDGSTSRPMRAE